MILEFPMLKWTLISQGLLVMLHNSVYHPSLWWFKCYGLKSTDLKSTNENSGQEGAQKGRHGEMKPAEFIEEYAMLNMYN